MGTEKDLETLFARAAAIAQGVPASMQDAAFHRALDLLTSDSAGEADGSPGPGRGQDAGRRRATTTSTTTTSTTGRAGKVASRDADELARLMNIDKEKAPEVDEQQGSLGHALALLVVARRELDIDGLTAPVIAKVLTDRFRHKYSRQAIGQALDKAGRLVDRRPGPPAIFRIMKAGEDWLAKPRGDGAEVSAHDGRSTKRRKSSVKPSSTPKAAAAGKPSESTPKRRSARPGPKESIERLLSSGYFAAPRSIAAVKAELTTQYALRFTSQDLSPGFTRLLREQKLTRTKNGDGIYEYTAVGT